MQFITYGTFHAWDLRGLVILTFNLFTLKPELSVTCYPQWYTPTGLCVMCASDTVRT